MAKFNLHGDIDNWNNFITNLIDKVISVPDNEMIELNISSFGGDVMVGMALGEALLRHKGKVKMTVDGMSGSMGAVLLTYADEVVATEGASFMFHKASSNDKSPGSVKILSNVNLNFKNRMIEKGIDAQLIKDVFENNQEIFLSAFEAKQKGVIDSVVKNERVGNITFEKIVASFNNTFNLKNKIMGKTKENEKSVLVFIALMDKDGNPLTTAFQTPSGVIEEGTMLLPLNGQEVVAGVYSFEGNRLTVDETGKVTAIEEIPEEDIEAKKHDDDDDKQMTAEAVGEIVSAAIEKAMGSMQAKVETSIQGKMESALKNIGTDFKFSASFDDKLQRDTVLPSEKAQGKAAERALKARIEKKQ